MIHASTSHVGIAAGPPEAPPKPGSRIADHPAVYRLIEVLWQEARYVDVTAKLVSSGFVRMERRKKTAEKQSRLETL